MDLELAKGALVDLGSVVLGLIGCGEVDAGMVEEGLLEFAVLWGWPRTSSLLFPSVDVKRGRTKAWILVAAVLCTTETGVDVW